MKRQNEMRKQRVAASFLGSNKKSCWKEISKIRGRTTRIALSIDGYMLIVLHLNINIYLTLC